MLAGYDVVLISTDHSNYDYDWIVKNAKLVVDSRNATGAVRRASRNVIKA
jgi:UDP-N-acetyl-D-glucosamine dehydrogenase